jgi:hypothetical protein
MHLHDSLIGEFEAPTELRSNGATRERVLAASRSPQQTRQRNEPERTSEFDASNAGLIKVACFEWAARGDSCTLPARERDHKAIALYGAIGIGSTFGDCPGKHCDNVQEHRLVQRLLVS